MVKWTSPQIAVARRIRATVLEASNKSSVDDATQSHYLVGCMTDTEFLLLIEQFIERHSLSPTTFGLWAMDDSRFVFDLRNGRSCYGRTMTRVSRFMDDYEKKQEARRLRTQQSASLETT